MRGSRHPLSLRARLTLAMALLALAVCAALAFFTFRAASDIIDRDARRTVDAVAESEKTMLVRTLTAQHERLGVFMENLAGCSTNDCVASAAQRVLEREHAEAALVTRPGVRNIQVGSWEGLDELPAPSMDIVAQPFRDRAGQHRYVITRTGADGASLRVIWKATDLDPLFVRVPALGQSGETFLADPEGYFMTTPRYEHPSGRSHPIRSGPMQRCLAGEDGTVNDLDYRGVLIIHGYRHIKEMGGGCIMAHIDLYEAEAPVRDLENQIILASVISALVAVALAVYLAKRLTHVIAVLGQYARAVAAGDLTTPLPPVKGTKEQEALAATLQHMAKGLHEEQQVRERFIGILAHDLKGPLSTVTLAADFVKKGENPSASTLQRANMISNAARRMDRMVSELLDFARSRRPEGLPVHTTDVDLGQLTAAAVEPLQSNHPERTIQLRSEGDVTAKCDSDRMFQVVNNLIGNALRYGAPDRPITVTLRGLEKEVELAVQSFGAPIPAEELRTIFDPFRRGRQASEHAHEGLGLGLYVVDQIAKAHGGRVEVTSSEEEGTTFTTHWPR